MFTCYRAPIDQRHSQFATLVSTDIMEPPIHNISSDLLFEIIALNANIFDDKHAVETVLTASHVCSSWRSFMLSIPSLWARLLDLDTLSKYSLNFFSEILKRGGNSLMWIVSDHFFQGIRDRRFDQLVITLITTQWARIQKLKLTFTGFTSNINAYVGAFFLPAPHLQSFDVIFRDCDTPDMLKDVQATTLFTGNAPMLRIFKASWCPISSSNEAVSWVQGLHAMYITEVLDMRRLVVLLGAAHNLRELSLKSSACRVVDLLGLAFIHRPLTLEVQIPLAPLPYLQYLELDCVTYSEYAQILFDHINLPNALNLSCDLEYPTGNYNINPLCRKLSALVQNYFGSYSIKKLSLSIAGDYSMHLKDESCPNVKNRAFNVSVQSRRSAPDILNALGSPALGYTTTLRLHSWYRPNCESISKFFVFFPAITCIETDAAALISLLYCKTFLQMTCFPHSKHVSWFTLGTRACGGGL